MGLLNNILLPFPVETEMKTQEQAPKGVAKNKEDHIETNRQNDSNRPYSSGDRSLTRRP